VKDTSLRVPSGAYGIVMEVKVSSRKEPNASQVDDDGDSTFEETDLRKSTGEVERTA